MAIRIIALLGKAVVAILRVNECRMLTYTFELTIREERIFMSRLLGRRICFLVITLVLCCGASLLNAYGDEVASSVGENGKAVVTAGNANLAPEDGQGSASDVTTQDVADVTPKDVADQTESNASDAPSDEALPKAEDPESEQLTTEEGESADARQAQLEEVARAEQMAREEMAKRQAEEEIESQRRAGEEQRAAQQAQAEAERLKNESKADNPEAQEKKDTNQDDAQDRMMEGLGAQKDALPSLRVSGHVQRIGDVSFTSDSNGFVHIGTSGQSLRLEAVGLSVQDAQGNVIKGISCKAHVQKIGWQDWVSDGVQAGTRGASRRLEAIRIALSGELENAYDIWYRVHIQRRGWLDWTSNGNVAGSVARGLRMEAIELKLVPKGSGAPGATGTPFVDGSGIGGEAHVQRIGWTSITSGKSVTIGTQGRSLRLEALRLTAVGFEWSGGVQYEAHVQRIGWQGMRSNMQVAGTEGQSLRIEALRLSLTGDLAAHYDVWYRVHAQTIGWLGWTSNGETAGTQGLSRRAEAIEIRLVDKGSGAPSSRDSVTENAFVNCGDMGVSYASYVGGSSWQGTVWNGATSGRENSGKRIESISAALNAAGLNGDIEYRVHVQSSGWTGWKKSGEEAGNPNSGKRIEAVGFRLTGMAARTMSVWYRVYAQGIGWLGWTRDGADAGTSSQGRRAEAYQVRLTSRVGAAPGDTANPFISQTKHAHMVLIGDSRTCSLYDTQYGGDSYDLLATDAAGNTWSARVGEGFAWMRDVGVPRVEDRIGADTAVVILLGVNDVANGAYSWNQYISYINEIAPRWIARGASVYYASLGPIGMQTGDDVDGSGPDMITNSGTITSWNNAMRAGLNTGCKYLDVYGALISDYRTVDGTHYDTATDRKLYSFIQNNVY